MSGKWFYAILFSLPLAACSYLNGEAPIEEYGEGGKIATSSAGKDSAAGKGAAGVGADGRSGDAAGTTGLADAQRVETQALPGAAAQVDVLKGGPGGGSPGGIGPDSPLKDPNNPLSKRVIYFEFDSAVISEKFRDLLDVHATWLREHKADKVILQGHADERGSREYNLALGQRRSESVRQAFSLLGVAEEQMEAVSLGEEKPAVEGRDESAWQMNRRAEIYYLGE